MWCSFAQFGAAEVFLVLSFSVSLFLSISSFTSCSLDSFNVIKAQVFEYLYPFVSVLMLVRGGKLSRTRTFRCMYISTYILEEYFDSCLVKCVPAAA